jgi:hypothetical protein
VIPVVCSRLPDAVVAKYLTSPELPSEIGTTVGAGPASGVE